jgi:hypothetical protein
VGTQVFDDGSSVTTDASGNVVSIVNSAGEAQPVPPADGSATMQQFSALFNQGVAAVTSTIATKLQGSLSGGGSATPGTPKPAASIVPANLQKYVPVALVALLIFAGYKYLKR